MQDVTGTGLELTLKASNTYPSGITITELAGDTDPFDIPIIKIAEAEMGLNGDLVVWSKAAPIPTTIATIPNSNADNNLKTLIEQNRAAKGKTVAKDEITLSGVYPDGKVIVLSKGVITDGAVANSVASAGKLKTGVYSFVFEQIDGDNSGGEKDAELNNS